MFIKSEEFYSFIYLDQTGFGEESTSTTPPLEDMPIEEKKEEQFVAAEYKRPANPPDVCYFINPPDVCYFNLPHISVSFTPCTYFLCIILILVMCYINPTDFVFYFNFPCISYLFYDFLIIFPFLINFPVMRYFALF